MLGYAVRVLSIYVELRATSKVHAFRSIPCCLKQAAACGRRTSQLCNELETWQGQTLVSRGYEIFLGSSA